MLQFHLFILIFRVMQKNQTQKSTKGHKLSNVAASRKKLSAYSHLTFDGIWFSIKEFTKSK
jgi:protein TIF31